MSAFDGILKNKMIQNVFLGQFKKIIKDQDLKCILIKVNESGEMDTETFTEDVKVLTISDYNNLMNSLKSQL